MVVVAGIVNRTAGGFFSASNGFIGQAEFIAGSGRAASDFGGFDRRTTATITP